MVKNTLPNNITGNLVNNTVSIKTKTDTVGIYYYYASVTNNIIVQ